MRAAADIAERWVRSGDEVEAVRVTQYNAPEIARWLYAHHRDFQIDGFGVDVRIQLLGCVAFHGDWIALRDSHIDTYGDESFRATHQPQEPR